MLLEEVDEPWLGATNVDAIAACSSSCMLDTDDEAMSRGLSAESVESSMFATVDVCLLLHTHQACFDAECAWYACICFTRSGICKEKGTYATGHPAGETPLCQQCHDPAPVLGLPCGPNLRRLYSLA